MQQGTITLEAVIEILDSGVDFSIGFRTRNENNGTGGEWIEFEKCKKLMRKTVAEIAAEKVPHEQPKRKNPRHYQNSTRNLLLPCGSIIKVHLRLIRLFNSKTVL